MRWGVGRRALASAAVVVVLGAPALVAAKECGGDVACACGDSVRGTAVLAADLTGCITGLRVKTNAVLDCAGHAITAAAKGAQEGIVVEAEGAIVRGCVVSRFDTGIRIRGGASNLLSGNDVAASGRYGIELAVATIDNEIVGNRVRGSGDEGIHVGSLADGNLIEANDIAGSTAENIYLLDVVGNTIRDNRISGGGSAALYVKHSSRNEITGNDIADRPVQLRGASEGNVFRDNRLTKSGFVLQAYDDATLGWKGPRANEVSGGSVAGVETCFRFEGATDNVVGDVVVDGCRPFTQSKSGGIAPVGNVVEVERAE